MPTQHLTSELLEITLDRTKALDDELNRILLRQYPPTGPEKLIQLALSANARVHKDVSRQLRSSSSLPNNPDLRMEIFLRDKTILLSILHLLMQCVEGADVQNCPVTFISPIRNMLAHYLGKNARFDLIVKASHAYNYMIWSPREEIKDVFKESGYRHLLTGFPEFFFIIECPISERRNIPIHCIFAHEVGHVLYQMADLTSKLMPLVQNPRDPIDTKLIKAAWVEELGADFIALCLLGPAYLYSFIYFAGPFCSSPSDTHPPDNLRIQFMCQMLLSNLAHIGLSYKKALRDNNNLNYVQEWLNYASNSMRAMPIERKYTPIIRSITSTITRIMEESQRTTIHKYTPRKYNREIGELCKNIACGIPINEIGFLEERPQLAKAESILNAGWSYLISGDNKYANLLNISDRRKVRERLFGLISKSLEYSAMQARWKN